MENPCDECEGAGTIRCTYCDGTGNQPDASLLQEQCPECDGAGRATCPRCQGAGQVA